jgi:uncharacterized protein YdaT
MSELHTDPDAVVEPVSPAFDEAGYKSQLASVKAQLASKDKKLKDANKDIQSRMTAEEKTALAIEAQNIELKELKRDKSVLGYSNALISEGFESESAVSMANALADGNVKDFLSGVKTFKESFEKAIKANMVNNMSTPPSGDAANQQANLQAQYKVALESGDTINAVRLQREIAEVKKK